MNSESSFKNDRRSMLVKGLVAVGGVLAAAPVARALSCGVTPEQTEGPFYPEKDQADKDTDLTWVQGGAGPALGRVILVQGVVSDENCRPVSGVLVEIWQACASGKYNHPSDPNPARLDPNFQYWGKALTDVNGFYRFKTVVPGAYQANSSWRRPPHIHFKVHKLGYHELITQLYFQGDPLNDGDLILKQIPLSERAKVISAIVEGVGALPLAEFNISIREVK